MNFEINTIGLLNLAQLLVPAMLEKGSGTVIATGNTSAHRGRANFSASLPPRRRNAFSVSPWPGRSVQGNPRRLCHDRRGDRPRLDARDGPLMPRMSFSSSPRTLPTSAFTSLISRSRRGRSMWRFAPSARSGEGGAGFPRGKFRVRLVPGPSEPRGDPESRSPVPGGGIPRPSACRRGWSVRDGIRPIHPAGCVQLPRA